MIKYKCICEHYCWQIHDTSLNVLTEIETLVVSKKNKTDIEILPQPFLYIPNSFKLNTNWSYKWTSDGTNSLDIQFFLDNDSISFLVSSGGLGGGCRKKYNGIKIMNN